MKRFSRQSAPWRAALAALCFSIAGVNAEPIIGLTSLTLPNLLVTFDSATPGTVSSPLAVTGLAAGDLLLGIDRRPSDGQLIGIARNTGNINQVTLYTINTTTGAATLIQSFNLPFTSPGAIGIDFNPVPNALRLVTDAEANLRITTGGTGTVNVDTNLTRTGAADPTLDIGAIAYSNNVPGGIGGVTTLYDINAATGQLFTQGSVNGSPLSPNTGMLNLVGSLGVLPINNLMGFDISGFTGTAYASLFSGGAAVSDNLYTINLATGQATLVGAINGPDDIIDITAALGAIPEPATVPLVAFGFALLGLLRRRRA